MHTLHEVYLHEFQMIMAVMLSKTKMHGAGGVSPAVERRPSLLPTGTSVTTSKQSHDVEVILAWSSCQHALNIILGQCTGLFRDLGKTPVHDLDASSKHTNNPRETMKEYILRSRYLLPPSPLLPLGKIVGVYRMSEDLEVNLRVL